MFESIDGPRAKRGRNLAVGFLVAIPAALLIFGVGIPLLKGVLMQAFVGFDSRLRMEDAYMNAICADMQAGRDEALCGCVLAVSIPALDCHAPFLAWSLERQGEQCADAEVREEARAFCACVDELSRLRDAEPDADERRRIVQRYERCAAFEGAPSLPSLEALAPAHDRS